MEKKEIKDNISGKITTIDAEGRILGKLAVEIAVLLRGKNNPNFARHKDMGGVVVVKNANKINLTGKKFAQKLYYHHTGTLGGMKAIPVKRVLEEKPNEVLRKAVLGMLPKNRMRAQLIKKLQFK